MILGAGPVFIFLFKLRAIFHIKPRFCYNLLMNTHDVFRRLAHKTGEVAGSPYAFSGALLVIVAWALLGEQFEYSDTWQLVINTGTTILTFLMVFLIQNMQNRESKAMQFKLDELIRAIKGARNGLVDLEDMSDEELDALEGEFRKIREKSRGFNQ